MCMVFVLYMFWYLVYSIYLKDSFYGVLLLEIVGC